MTTPELFNLPKGVSIEEIEQQQQLLAIHKEVEIQKALTSGDYNKIYTARRYLQSLDKRQEQQPSKSLLVDPLDMGSSMGYKEKLINMSYDLIRAMAKVGIIKAIIETRKDQVAAFCTPQDNKYSPGFIIQKKSYGNRMGKKQVKMTRQESKAADDLADFICNCGQDSNKWHADDFETFTHKYMDDSFTMDQGTAEIIRSMQGEIVEFFATDGATYRIADTYDEDNYSNNYVKRQAVNGYLPSYVQVWNGQIHAEYYPWELMFGIRNPKTDIRKNGYGTSELEEMISTVTSILNSDFYNANFFKVGSSPKGILRVHGQVNQAKIDEFRNQWQTQVAGVLNMHKIPILHAEKADFVPMQMTNKDMEFGNYQDFLIKLACAIFKIDPSEIGFPMSGSSTSKPLFEGNNEARLEYSRDKGLAPAVRKFKSFLNKWIVSEKDPRFEIVFNGLKTDDAEDELDNDIKSAQNIETLNEVRKRRDLPPLQFGDMPLNPVYAQQVSMQQQMQMQGDQQSNDAMAQQDDDEDNDNPFVKSIVNDVEKYFFMEPKIIVPSSNKISKS